MLYSYRIKEWLNWPIIRVHLCTLAISVCLNTTWRVPRDGFRYGGVEYGIILTVAMVTVALPVTLLQLSVGQLSQQDAVGVWRAVPFFKGVGYIRVLVSFLGASYTIIYVALTITYLLYTSANSIPFPICIEVIYLNEEYIETNLNATACISKTILSPISSGPEYFIALSLISLVLWILSPFIFYNPVKFMKRIFYTLTPVIITVGIVICACIGDGQFDEFVENGWGNVNEPYIWHSAIIQALWACQIAGGYLIPAGDSVYSNTNVEWTSILLVVISIFASWMSLLFWYSIGGAGDKDTSVLAALMQTYQVAVDGELSIVWPILVFLMIILSGFISMITLLYPVYDRLRRIGGIRWRMTASLASLVGAAVSILLLTGQIPILTSIEDIALPLLITAATVLEILVFGFAYGWKNLIEDIEFLKGNGLVKYWVWGWWFSSLVIVSTTSWWATYVFLSDVEWTESPWEASTFVSSALVGLIFIAVCATVAVWKQDQYDVFGKLKSSFQPSRHWGPRDPITHYYWLASRDDPDNNIPRTRYYRRELGQLSTRPSFLTISETVSKEDVAEEKKRSNSDDWIYTTGRKENLIKLHNEHRRSKSLDWTIEKDTLQLGNLNTENNNVIGFRYIKKRDNVKNVK